MVALKDAGLTSRELEIVRAVAKARTVVDAADALRMPGQSLKNRLSEIYRNVGVRSLTGLVVWALKVRLLTVDEL